MGQGFLGYKKNKGREGGSQPRREKRPFPLKNPKSFLPPF